MGLQGVLLIWASWPSGCATVDFLSFRVCCCGTSCPFRAVVDKDKESKKYVAIVDSNSNSSKTAINVGDELTEDVTKSLMLSYTVSSTAMTGANVSADNTFHLNNSEATYDAKQYYIDVKKSSNPSYDGSDLPAGPTVTNAFDGNGNQVKSGKFVITEITSAAAVTVQFLVWLNGADEACFDAIAAHAWTLSMNFELGEGTALDVAA